MKGRSNYAYEKLAPCAAEPVKLDSYGLASHVPYTPLPRYLPQLPPSVWTSQEHLISHPLHGTHGAQHLPTLLPVLLVSCYWAAPRLKPRGAMEVEPSLAKIPAFEGSALVKFGQNWPMGLNY